MISQFIKDYGSIISPTIAFVLSSMLLEGRSAKIFASFPKSSALLKRSPKFCHGIFDTFSLPSRISCMTLSRVDLPALGAPTKTKDLPFVVFRVQSI